MKLKLTKKFLTCLLLISQISCSQSKKITNDFCYYKPLQPDIEPAVIEYWKKIQKNIEEKNLNGKIKTPEEKFFEIVIDNIATNEFRFYEKKCDKIN